MEAAGDIMSFFNTNLIKDGGGIKCTFMFGFNYFIAALEIH